MGFIKKNSTKNVSKKTIHKNKSIQSKFVHKAKVLSNADIQANRSQAYSFLSL